MMDAIKERRSINSRFRRECQELVIRSKLPAPIAKTLAFILSKIGSATHYELAWVSHAAIADALDLSERTVEWHCKAILEAGLLTAQKLGCREARRLLKEQYGYDLKGGYAHLLCFYSINRGHPFWAGDQGATEDTLAKIREALAGRDRKRTRPASNPVAGYASNPVAGDTANPVAGFGKALTEEAETAASAKHPHPLEERAHREPGTALRAGRGDDSPDPGERVHISDYIQEQEIEERTKAVEAEHPQLSRPTTLDPNTVAGRVVKLWYDWKAELGRYPDPWMVADTIGSPLFKGIKNLNWGTLTSRSPVAGGSPFRDRLYQGVVDRFRLWQASTVDSPARGHFIPDDEEMPIGSDW
jgi:DNA-binding transcriptional ArsR family regulator